MANQRPWPTSINLSQVNTTPQSDGEMQQVLATLNNLITQFNQLVQLGGSLGQQIQRIVKQLNAIYPGLNLGQDDGYITNSILQNWPHDHFAISDGATGYLDIDLTSPKTTLGTSSGPLHVLGGPTGGTVYLDAAGDGGICEDASGNVILGAGGNDVLTVTIGGSPSVVISAAAGDLLVESGGIFLDATYGFTLSGSTISTGAALAVTGVVQAGGYNSSDGSAGQSVSTGGLTFKNGLCTGGTATGGATPGTVTDVTDTQLRVRTWDGTSTDGGDPAIPIGTWVDMEALFPGIGTYPGTSWAGSTGLTTLGTIVTGTWNGDAIGLAYIEPLSAGTLLGNDTAGSAAPTELGTTAIKTMLSISNVENTALSTWAGTANIATVGTIATGVWHGTTVAIGYGGTGQTTAAAAFNALSPMTTQGDMIFGSTSGAGVRLGGNTSSVKMWLLSYGNTSIAYNPSWSTIEHADITNLASWPGSTAIVTLGTVATCANMTIQGTLNVPTIVSLNAIQAYGIKAIASNPNINFMDSGGTTKGYVDTSTGVWYPTRLVIPVF